MDKKRARKPRVVNRVGFSYDVFNPFKDSHEGLYYVNPKGVITVDTDGWLLLSIVLRPGTDDIKVRMALGDNKIPMEYLRICLVLEDGEYDFEGGNVISNLSKRLTRQSRAYIFVKIDKKIKKESVATQLSLQITTRSLSTGPNSSDTIKLSVTDRAYGTHDYRDTELEYMSKAELATFISEYVGFADKEALINFAKSVNKMVQLRSNPYRESKM